MQDSTQDSISKYQKNTSLITLAKQGKLPLHQYMDHETLDWIIRNKPLFSKMTCGRIDIPTLSYLRNYLPLRKWFFVPDEISTIHGLRHILRVAVYSLMLYNFIPKTGAKKQNIVIAAVLHDIRRTNDKDNESHGQRAAEWFLNNTPEINRHFKIKLSSQDIKEIYYAIHYHATSYNIISKGWNYKRYKDVIDIIKTADALDRYRQPKLKWWINEHHLVLIPPDELKQFAYNLVVTSEKRCFEGVHSVDSVLISLNSYKHESK